MPYYTNPIRSGLDAVSSLGDGYTINIRWFTAYPSIKTNKIAYHIYFSTDKRYVFFEGVKFVSIDGSVEANIIDLVPGQEYFFSVRPVEYNPSQNDFSALPISHDNLRFYPYSILRQDITVNSVIVPLLDVEGFPVSGIVKVGAELIQYSGVDTVNSNLMVTERGFGNSVAIGHEVSGYDGYVQWNPAVVLFAEGESSIFDRIFVCQSRFEYPHFSFTIVDGYKQVLKDLSTTDLSENDATNVDFPAYDYSGYHRTDPVELLNGTCVGSYIGGEQGCIDGYGNVMLLRGLSVQDRNNQNEEIALSLVGRRAVLVKRMHTGVVCSCYQPSSEYQDDRCPLCYGTKFVFGYEQYFNPRESDGKILVRMGPAEEKVKITEAGEESDYQLDMWTLTVPTIKDRDVLILFDTDNLNEEFRYEVLSVTRNNTLIGQYGGQKMRVQRIRKTDPAYQIRVFRDTSSFPAKLNTSLASSLGIPVHTHQIVISEKITAVNQINQTTAVAQGHNHPIVNGVVMEVLGHTHTIILP